MPRSVETARPPEAGPSHRPDHGKSRRALCRRNRRCRTPFVLDPSAGAACPDATHWATSPVANKGDPMDNSVLVPRAQLRRLGDELAGALRAVTQARGSSDAVE